MHRDYYSQMYRQTQTGFTIIELMIVVAIAAILALLAMPSMQDTVLNQRVRKSVSDMHLSLLFARSEAIKRNATINLVRGGATWADGWTVQSGATVLRTNDALSSVTVACDTNANGAADACPATISFTRTGRPSSMIDFWSYVNGNDKVIMRCVGVSLSGRPTVVVDADNNTANGCN